LSDASTSPLGRPPGDPCFRLTGAVSLANLMDIRRQGEAALAAAAPPVRMDISGLENGNSAALALLMAWFRAARAQDKAVTFTGVPAELQKIIELSGMTSVLPLEHQTPVDSAGRESAEQAFADRRVGR
jgi:phospholipid transport system transporter-binding protein